MNINPPDTTWRVLWTDHRQHHDWIGGRGPGKKHRKPPAPLQRQDFETQAEAETFVSHLRIDIGADEIAVQIIPIAPLGPDLLPPRPAQLRLPGDWPLQRRP